MTDPGSDSLTDREEEVLAHLARLRFLTTAHLAEFVYGGSSVTPRSRTVLTQRGLATLKRRGLVAMRPRIVGGPVGGEGQPTYHLTPAGVRVSKSLWPGVPSRRFRSSGAFLARHAMATAEVILAFRRAARARTDEELVTWECDWQAALPLGSSVLEPDAYLLYRARDKRLHAFVEVDMGSEYGRFVSAKMRRYLDLHRAGTWRVRAPVWPVILFVAPTEARLVQLRRLAEGVSTIPTGGWNVAASFYFTTLATVTGERTPLDAIWQVIGHAGVHGLVREHAPEPVVTV